jgi:hypothetical protein
MPMVQPLRRLPSIIDSQRWQVEFEALQKYTHGVHEDDLLEAVHRMVIDLLDAGHTPSQDMLRMISGELKAAWWPDRKQHRRSKEWAFLACVQQETNFWAGSMATRAARRRRPSRTSPKAAASASAGCAGSSLVSARVAKSTKPHWSGSASAR